MLTAVQLKVVPWANPRHFKEVRSRLTIESEEVGEGTPGWSL